MVDQTQTTGGLEWRIRANNGSSKLLVPESGFRRRTWLGFSSFLVELKSKTGKFLWKAWAIGDEDPKKFIHCLKVALALTLVSVFYYVNPLYRGVGDEDAVWGIMTVALVYEYTAGATIYKCLNRITATIAAGILAVAINAITNHCSQAVAPVILEVSVLFVAASLVTFTRFIPKIKGRFDYGCMVFILTFCMVGDSGFQVKNLFQRAYERVLTVVIGIVMCLLTSIFIRPIWEGEELHLLITRNMEALANSVDGCVAEFFKENNNNGNGEDNEDRDHKNLLAYKRVLNTKAVEDAFANFAGWEPAYCRFSFRRPWEQYLKIGALMRNCAFCLEVLNGCISSEVQASDFMKQHLRHASITLSFHCSSVLQELAISFKTMRRSSKLDFLVEEMKTAQQELRNAMKSLPSIFTLPPSPLPFPDGAVEEDIKEAISTPTIKPLVGAAPLITVASVLIELVARIEGVVKAGKELAKLVDFQPQIKKTHPTH